MSYNYHNFVKCQDKSTKAGSCVCIWIGNIMVKFHTNDLFIYLLLCLYVRFHKCNAVMLCLSATVFMLDIRVKKY